MTRRCGICEEPTVELQSTKRIRLGIEELGFACRSCGWTFTTFNPVGHAVWWALIALLNIGWVVIAVEGKIKDGDGLWIGMGMLALDLWLAVVGVRAWRNDRKHPPVR